MKRPVKYALLIGLPLVCLIVIGVILLLGPDGNQAAPSHSHAEPLTAHNASELYLQAISHMSDDDLQVTVTQTEQRSIGDMSFQLETDRLIRYQLSDCADPRYHVSTTHSTANHRVLLEEYFIAGQYRFSISGTQFQADYDKTAFLSALPPPYLLDANKYRNIGGTETDDGYQIDFSGATALESWIDDSGVLESATGVAILSREKELISVTYTASYYKDSVQYQIRCEAAPKPLVAPITIPDSDDRWLVISSPAAPMALEDAVCMLLQADSVSASYQEEIYFEALGDKRSRSILLSYRDPQRLTANITTTTLITNDSRLQQPDESQKTETFRQGQYAVSLNSDPEVSDPSISNDAMLQYLQNQLIGTIMLPEYISSCSATTRDNMIRYEYTGSESYGDFLCRNAGQQLYQNPEILFGEDVTVENDTLICYLEVDVQTGLPLRSGIQYIASCQTGGLPYRFTYEASQDYQIGSE